MAESTYDREFRLYAARMDAWYDERQRIIADYMRATVRIFRLRDF